MSQQLIAENIQQPFGPANQGLGDDQGDTWNSAIAKINAMFAELYASTGITYGAGLALAGGVLEVPNGGISNAMLGGSIAASKLVGTDIATLGTITAGTWEGSTISVPYGGTGATAFTANGLLYGNGSGAIDVLTPNASTNKFLTQSSSGAPAWNTIASSDLPGGFNGFANPSGSLGLIAVNGSAATAMRSDATPALGQGITPTWSGLHTFTAGTSFIGSTTVSALRIPASYALSPSNATMVPIIKALPTLAGQQSDAFSVVYEIGVSADNLDSSAANGTIILYVADVLSGTNLKGDRTGIFAELTLTSPTGNLAAANAFYAAHGGQAQASVSDNGAIGNFSGNLFGGNDVVVLNTGALYWQSIAAYEADVQVAVGASVNYKYGLSVVQIPGDATAGAVENLGIRFVSSPTNYGTAVFTNGQASIAMVNAFAVGQAVFFQNSGGGLPANFSANTFYYVVSTGLSGTAFQAAATPGGSAIVAGSAGSGTQACWIISPGWTEPISFGSGSGYWPVAVNGTLIGTTVSAVSPVATQTYYAAIGVDFSAVVFSTAFLKSTGFLVDGAGNATATALTLSTLSTAGIVVNNGSGVISSNHTVNAASVAANFTADHRLTLTIGATTYYLPVSTTAW